jgi:mRNA interferase MazF
LILNFDTWNDIKKQVNAKEGRVIFKERDVFWCNLGVNIGDEQDGKGREFTRPVIILRKYNKNIFLGVPMTSKTKNNEFYHKIDFQGKSSCALLSQLKVIDSKRLLERLGSLSNQDFYDLKRKIINVTFKI